MSDTTIVNGMQTIIRTVQLDGDNAFQNDSVVIDDWDYLDQSIVNEPFCNIETPALLSSRYELLTCETNTWLVRVTLVKPFVDWSITRPALRKLRTAVLDTFNSGDNRSIDGLDSVFIEDIRDEFPDAFLEIYDRYVVPEQTEENLPIYLAIPVLFEVSEE